MNLFVALGREDIGSNRVKLKFPPLAQKFLLCETGVSHVWYYNFSRDNTLSSEVKPRIDGYNAALM